MEENLISKKDLLELMGISYGQLYRWKRKNLIPEDWFIKKSSFTGQETFFPKDKILERIDKIINMKDDASLDELAQVFSPMPSDVALTKEELFSKKIVAQMSMDIYESIHGETKIFSFEKILFVGLLETLLHSGEVSLDEGKLALQTVEQYYKNFEGRDCEIVLVRKFGVATCFLIGVPNEAYIETGAKLVLKVNISKSIEELKLKI
ncbi:YhbD family protein [Clostridium sp. YIM B02515]|uniref:YhbD family protein n=1 Tax=Clostridium rhizosphaerae TaxID=2803861 RepID=A0ABS1TFV1_9CLOT|nr:YhbD family protein [Clostridium rhizosphaerae]MBL4937491.1 YhbD family protein [Clostridium rhizosphaerae]